GRRESTRFLIVSASFHHLGRVARGRRQSDTSVCFRERPEASSSSLFALCSFCDFEARPSVRPSSDRSPRMTVFHCDHCDQPVFFENSRCVACGHLLAYLPELGEIASLEPVGEAEFTSPLPVAGGRRFRLCRNYTEAEVCNWTVSESDGAADLC